MFDRFTDRAQRVVRLAFAEAIRFNHSRIGPEHILLGLLSEKDGLGSKVLQSLGITHEGVERQVAGILGRGTQPLPGGRPFFSPQGKHVLELAVSEWSLLGGDYIDTEHLLLGLITECKLHDANGVAAQILAGLGINLDHVRLRVMQMLAAY
jgi:ATP-dependent Clp protease ATP-binding subunit ClpC